MLFNSLAVASLAGLASARTVATSSVKGKAFDRMAIIYFENENYAKSIGDEDFAWLASKGITLTNSYGVTHPSQPNYVASISGDYFGLQDDGHAALPDNVFTVIDLLESKDISWAHYQEDMPYAGYQNESYVNQKTGANDYVRKHNPGVHFANVVSSQERLQRLTTFSQTNSSNSQFHKDLANHALPQWMFITPNMTSDGHDTDVKFGGRWCRAFLEPLLNNKHFMENTMVLISWDEAEIVATRPNQILGILLGDAVPKELVGTSDDNFYTHYSSIATVSANWDLPTLGRWDVGANVFGWVAKKTGDVLHSWCSSSDKKNHYYATPYAGYLNPGSPNTEIPSPNLALSPAKNGRSVLPAIVSAWKDSKNPTYYTDSIRVADGRNPPKGYEMD